MNDTPNSGSGIKLHPRLLLAAFLVAIVMVPVAFFLTGIGILVLKMAGGAASDTSTVVMVAAIAVCDFWGGGITYSLTRTDRASISVAWTLGRLPVIIVGAFLSHTMVVLAPVLLAVAGLASLAGARMARTQAMMRRQANASVRR